MSDRYKKRFAWLSKKSPVFVVAVAVAVFLCALTPGSNVVYAKAGGGGTGKPNNAKCAILDQGLVVCPVQISQNDKYKGKCFYMDLGNPTAGKVSGAPGWVEDSSCDSDIYKGSVVSNIAEQCQTNPDSCNDPALKCTTSQGADNCDLVKKYIDPLIVALSAAVGVVATISIIVGGIQYASSAGDPQKANAAKSRIVKAIIALIGYLLLYAVLAWLIPGGLPT